MVDMKWEAANIQGAQSPRDYQRMAQTGREVLPEVYAPYFPREWADHLLEAGHTVPALEAQAAKGYRHYLVEVGSTLAGYFAVHEREDGIMELSHLYFRAEFRGKGLGQRVMSFVHREADRLGVPGIELWVLRKNLAAVNFYRRHGYYVAREVMTPIGPGAELEDYVMRRDLPQK